MLEEGPSFPPYEESLFDDPLRTARYFAAYGIDEGRDFDDSLRQALDMTRQQYGLGDEEVQGLGTLVGTELADEDRRQALLDEMQPRIAKAHELTRVEREVAIRTRGDLDWPLGQILRGGGEEDTKTGIDDD